MPADILYLVAVFAVGFVYGAAATLFFTAGDQRALAPLPTTALIAAILVGAVLAVAFVLLALVSWKHAGGRAALRERDRAARSGELPEGASADVWLPKLRTRRQSLSQMRWTAPLLAATQLFLAIPQLLKLAGTYSILFWAADALLFVGLGIWSLAVYPKRVRSVDRLIGQLQP